MAGKLEQTSFISRPSDENLVFKILILREENGNLIPSEIASAQALKRRLEEHFNNKEEKFVFDAFTLPFNPSGLVNKLKEFRPNSFIVDFSSLHSNSYTLLVKILTMLKYEPRRILAINADHNFHEEASRWGGDNLYTFYIDKGENTHAMLIEVLGYLWIRRYEFAPL